MSLFENDIQGSTNRWAPGLVNFVPALAYHFCLNLPTAFTQPGARLLVEPCKSSKMYYLPIKLMPYNPYMLLVKGRHLHSLHIMIDHSAIFAKGTS